MFADFAVFKRHVSLARDNFVRKTTPFTGPEKTKASANMPVLPLPFLTTLKNIILYVNDIVTVSNTLRVRNEI